MTRIPGRKVSLTTNFSMKSYNPGPRQWSLLERGLSPLFLKLNLFCRSLINEQLYILILFFNLWWVPQSLWKLHVYNIWRYDLLSIIFCDSFLKFAFKGWWYLCFFGQVGGIPVGVIYVETRTAEMTIPADPANLDSETKVSYPKYTNLQSFLTLRVVKTLYNFAPCVC